MYSTYLPSDSTSILQVLAHEGSQTKVCQPALLEGVKGICIMLFEEDEWCASVFVVAWPGQSSSHITVRGEGRDRSRYEARMSEFEG